MIKISKSTAHVNRSFRRNVIMILSFMMLIGCSNDEQEPFITIEPLSVSFAEINTCDISSCCLATRFEFNLGYSATGGAKVSKLLVDIKWSDGDESSQETQSFQNTGSGINYTWCYKFGNAEWVQVTNRLVSNEGIVSAPTMVQVNKPEGAN